MSVTLKNWMYLLTNVFLGWGDFRWLHGSYATYCCATLRGEVRVNPPLWQPGLVEPWAPLLGGGCGWGYIHWSPGCPPGSPTLGLVDGVLGSLVYCQPFYVIHLQEPCANSSRIVYCLLYSFQFYLFPLVAFRNGISFVLCFFLNCFCHFSTWLWQPHTCTFCSKMFCFWYSSLSKTVKIQFLELGC